ncbi:conserved protein of unknown function [Rhodovastum atsumiense]|uniref:Uncharacterized protein n=1 Tax=Rhodovastum atsumiense TaxID=504468 RepID=A0A5M6J265_9PROT|nr:hypothetical protein [Rhodovastum atsumiense]KAA5614690.1 hypothetical protein F1189_00755 [Rhodovastum atsumiense]CAH2599778.1 conserved protein of unknown function [Rhodovastum atsumiense]
MHRRTPPDDVRRILAELTEVPPEATAAERQEALQWCLRTLILPPESRAALEARLAALRAPPQEAGALQRGPEARRR